MMAGAEGEIRWLAWRRVGLEWITCSSRPAWLPGVWGSGTYRIMEKQDIRARMTLAYGKSGLLFYFTVGQTF
jgi:hypothetical protein